MKNNRFSKILPCLKSFFEIHFVCFLILMFVYVSPILQYQEFEIPLLYKAPAAVILPFLYYSLQRIYASYDEVLHDSYIEMRKESSDSMKEKLRFLLTQKRLYIELAGVAAIYLIFPLKLFFGAFSDLFFGGDAGWTTKGILFPLLMTLFFALTAAARLRAIRRWHTWEKQGNDIWEKHLAKKRSKARDKEAFSAAIVYFLAGGLFGLYMNVIKMFAPLAFGILKKPAVYGTLLFLLVFVLLLRWGRALIKRISLMTELKKVCREQKYRIKSLRHPYLSLFFLPKGANFILERRDKCYSCKMIGVFRKKSPLSILPNGCVKYIHRFYVRGGFGGGIELFRHVKTVNFGYESEDRKILIINPTSSTLQTERNGQTYLLDNGFTVGDYKIFTASAFLNALERDTLDK